MDRPVRRWPWLALLLPVLVLAGASQHSSEFRSGSAEICAGAGTAEALKQPVCCKVCTKGKACGNTCIARDKICHQPPGCACNG